MALSSGTRLGPYQIVGPLDIEVMTLSGGPSSVVAATSADERNGRLSPDGRWIAYTSNESGSFEVYVQPFPTTGAKWQVSKEGGQQPQWRRDVTADGQRFLVNTATDATQPITLVLNWTAALVASTR